MRGLWVPGHYRIGHGVSERPAPRELLRRRHQQAARGGGQPLPTSTDFQCYPFSRTPPILLALQQSNYDTGFACHYSFCEIPDFALWNQEATAIWLC